MQTVLPGNSDSTVHGENMGKKVRNLIGELVFLFIVFFLGQLIADHFGWSGSWKEFLCIAIVYTVLYLCIVVPYEAITMRLARKKARADLKQKENE